ncbi:MAG: TonB family protein [Bacteroidales bacterium]|nr:TonB family protein [Bacteroidales bacterium]
MKRFIYLTICILLSAGISAAQSYDELFVGDDALALRSTADSLSALKGEDALADFVAKRLSSSGLDLLASADFRSFGIQKENGDTLTCHNVIAWLPGYGKQLHDNYIVISTSLSESSATAIALFLSIAEKLNTNKVLLQRSVLFAAFGGAADANSGSWYFLNRAFEESSRIDAFVNLDYFDNPNKGFYAYTGSNADMNRLIAGVSSSLQPALPELTSREPAKSDFRSFYGKEIPGVFFTTAEPGKTYRGGIDPLEYEELTRQGEYIYNFCVSLSGAGKPSFWPSEDGPADVVVFDDCDVKPSFLGRKNPSFFLANWVYVYLRYPKYAQENGIQGKVLVEFTIDEKGHVCNVKVKKGIHPSLDEEAVRVIEASPDWKPGMVNGKPVRCTLSVYVDFVLEKKKNKLKNK